MQYATGEAVQLDDMVLLEGTYGVVTHVDEQGFVTVDTDAGTQVVGHLLVEGKLPGWITLVERAPAQVGQLMTLRRSLHVDGRDPVEYRATCTFVEDRGEYWYVGYRPQESHLHGYFGALRVPRSPAERSRAARVQLVQVSA